MEGEIHTDKMDTKFIYDEENGTLKLANGSFFTTKDGHIFKSENGKSLKFKPSIFKFLTKKPELNIPKKIWQTNKKPPENGSKLYYATEKWKEMNPDWSYNFIDDETAIKFCDKNFKENVGNSIKTLLPGAFKADLIRACYMFIEGGVYADIKLEPLFPLSDFIDRDLILVKDKNNNGIWNGFIASAPGNEYFLKIIKRIVANVMKKRKGKNCLDVTGPKVWEDIYQSHFSEKSKTGVFKDKRILFHQTEGILGKKKFISILPNEQRLIEWSGNYEGREGYYSQWKSNNIYDKTLWDVYFGKTPDSWRQ